MGVKKCVLWFFCPQQQVLVHLSLLYCTVLPLRNMLCSLSGEYKTTMVQVMLVRVRDTGLHL